MIAGLDIDAAARRATGVFTGNSLVRVAHEFSTQPTKGLSAIAAHSGFSAAATALETGRIDTLASAVGSDAIGMLAEDGARALMSVASRAAGQLSTLVSSLGRGDPPPAGHVMLVLGGFAFMVSTIAHQSLKRTSEYRWALQERLLRSPARQFVGPGDERIELEGYLLPHYTGGGSALPALRKIAERGQPHDLVDHFGAAYGRYVIETIEETGAELDIYGQPRRIDFRVALALYGEDAPFLSFVAGTIAANIEAPQNPGGSKNPPQSAWETAWA